MWAVSVSIRYYISFVPDPEPGSFESVFFWGRNFLFSVQFFELIIVRVPLYGLKFKIVEFLFFIFFRTGSEQYICTFLLDFGSGIICFRSGTKFRL